MRTLRELKVLAAKELDAPSLKVALLGDTATQLLVTSLKGEAVARNMALNIFEGEYNQIERQLLDPTSDFYQFDADLVIIFQSTHKLCEYHSLLSVDRQEQVADERLSFLSSLCENPYFVNKKIIYFNYPEIEDTVFGSYANKVEASFSFQVRKLNYELMLLSRQYPNLFVCDIAGLQNLFGRQFMFSPNVYMSTEMVLSVNALPYVASRIVDII
jgi:predicted enzyme involved in methoxymalonyl-ACP biosynthesis